MKGYQFLPFSFLKLLRLLELLELSVNSNLQTLQWSRKELEVKFTPR